MGHGAIPVTVGVAVGLVASIGLTQVMSGLLYGISPFDGATLAAAVATLGTVGLLACWLPARRAARLPPAEALEGD